MRPALLLPCLVIGTAARAQAPAASDAPIQTPPLLSATSDAPLQTPRLPRLEVGDPLRVVREKGAQQAKLEGRLLEWSARSITMEVSSIKPPEQVPVSEILELSVVKRSPGYGALVGTGAGILLGTFAGLSICGYFEGSVGSDDQCELNALTSALGGAVLGAGVGALLGLTIPRWESVYERAPEAATDPN
jgi:hypothetical protein